MATTKQTRFTLIMMGIVVGGLLILSIGAYFVYCLNQANDRLDKATLQIQDDIQRIQENTKDLPRLQNQLTGLKRELATQDSNMVQYEYIPTYLAQIQQTTLRTGNVIQSIQPHELKFIDLDSSPLAPGDDNKGTPANGSAAGATPAGIDVLNGTGAAAGTPGAKPHPQYRVQQIRLEVRGTYASLLSLLDAFRQFPKMIYVRTLSITPQNREGSGNSVVATIETYAIIAPDQYKDAPTTAQTAAQQPGEARHE